MAEAGNSITQLLQEIRDNQRQSIELQREHIALYQQQLARIERINDRAESIQGRTESIQRRAIKLLGGAGAFLVVGLLIVVILSLI